MTWTRQVPFVLCVSLMWLSSTHGTDETVTATSGAECTLSIANEECSLLTPMSDRFTDLLDVNYWNNFCRLTSLPGRQGVCLHAVFSICDVDSPFNLYPSPETVANMASRFCDGETVTQQVTTFFGDPEIQRCIDKDIIKSNLTACLDAWLYEAQDTRSVPWNTLPTERQQSLARFAHSTFSCVKNHIFLDCPAHSRDKFMSAVNLTLPEELRGNFPLERVSEGIDVTVTLSTERTTVGVFGSSHLLLDGVKELQTCHLTGEHVLFKNPETVISGNFTSVGGHSTMTMVNVDFIYSGRPLGSYTARNSNLPAHFVGREDGQMLGRDKDRQISIATEDVAKGELIRINSTTRALELLIRRWGAQYQFVLRLGAGVVGTAGGLLVTGCSYKDEQIVNMTGILESAHSDERTGCEVGCGEIFSQAPLNETDDSVGGVKDSCLYDCILGREPTVVEMTQYFLADLLGIMDTDKQIPGLLAPAPTDPAPVAVVHDTGSVTVSASLLLHIAALIVVLLL